MMKLLEGEERRKEKRLINHRVACFQFEFSLKVLSLSYVRFSESCPGSKFVRKSLDKQTTCNEMSEYIFS